MNKEEKYWFRIDLIDGHSTSKILKAEEIIKIIENEKTNSIKYLNNKHDNPNQRPDRIQLESLEHKQIKFDLDEQVDLSKYNSFVVCTTDYGDGIEKNFT